MDEVRQDGAQGCGETQALQVDERREAQDAGIGMEQPESDVVEHQIHKDGQGERTDVGLSCVHAVVEQECEDK